MSTDAIRGSLTALVTPFKDGQVDADGFQKLVDWQIKSGTNGLVPVGTTGESATLSHDEHNRVVELCVEAAAGRVPVIAGAGANATWEGVSLIQAAEKSGADAALVVTPYYNKPGQEGMYAHFKTLNDATGLPIIMYNIPGRSVVDMSVDTMARLYELTNIVGVKDATGDLNRVSEQRAAMGADFIQLSGEDGTALGFNAHGGVGCISVSANVAPAECAAFQKASLAGDIEGALAWQDKLLGLHQAMFCDPSPGPAKYGVAKRLGVSGEVRLPMTEPSGDACARIDAAMALLGIEG
jgi:4-hydroxy-tetrahydrodipicolinate synthase